MIIRPHAIIALCCAAVTITAASTAHAAATVKDLHVLTKAQGEQLQSPLVISNGVLYGTAPFAAGTLGGLVYSVNASTGAYSVVHAFNTIDATQPYAGLLVYNGALWGAADFSASGYNGGAIYSIDLTTGAFSIVHTFSGTDGAYPLSSLIAVNGLLYGTTASGGTYGDGNVFALDPVSGNVTSLYSFAGNGSGDGNGPVAEVYYLNGALYGTTEFGGGSGCNIGCGTVFKLDLASNTETVLYTFSGGSDGGGPTAGLAYANGAFYGVTSVNGGSSALTSTVFKIDPASGAFTTIHTFNGKDGSNPIATLTADGSLLYGTAQQGGPGNAGTIFSITPGPDSFALVANLSGHGHFPNGLLLSGGALYGDTAGPNKTVVFRLKP